MSAELTVWAFDSTPRLFKALIAAEYAGVKLNVITDLDDAKLKSPEFTALNPNQKAPVLKTESGSIWESNAVARYIARVGTPAPSFLGASSFLASQVDQWIEWTRGELEIQLQVWLYPIWGYIPNNAEATNLAKEDVKRALNILNQHLQLRSFLVGDRLSLADIIVALTLLRGYQLVFDGAFRKPFQHVTRWFTTVVNQPNVLKVIGAFELCEKAQVAPDAPAKAPAAEKKKVVEEKKKEEKKPQPKKKKDDDEEDVPDVPPEPKKANPLDALPPSSFSLEEWKRTYSNEKDTRKACEWLWSHYDREGFSTWFVKYKYNDELEVVFKSCNLIGGYIQRLDSLRKYGFGCILLFGDDKKMEISGIFIVRGRELPAEITECPDSTSYEFTRANIDDPAERQKFDDYLCWDGSFGGVELPFSQGKQFK